VEEEKAIYMHIYQHTDSKEIVACRRLLEDGNLHLRIDVTKKDQSKCFFEILYKKKEIIYYKFPPSKRSPSTANYQFEKNADWMMQFHGKWSYIERTNVAEVIFS
jgi:hypothetical protein